MKRYLILIVCLIFWGGMKGQDINCDLLKNAIETNFFHESFGDGKLQTDSTFIIYDKSKMLNTCMVFTEYNKQILISHDTTYNKYHPNRNRKDIPNNLIVCAIEKKGKKYFLWFWMPYSNQTLNLTYIIKKGKSELIEMEDGAF